MCMRNKEKKLYSEQFMAYIANYQNEEKTEQVKNKTGFFGFILSLFGIARANG